MVGEHLFFSPTYLTAFTLSAAGERGVDAAVGDEVLQGGEDFVCTAGPGHIVSFRSKGSVGADLVGVPPRPQLFEDRTRRQHVRVLVAPSDELHADG